MLENYFERLSKQDLKREWPQSCLVSMIPLQQVRGKCENLEREEVTQEQKVESGSLPGTPKWLSVLVRLSALRQIA
jgi:hypothetical protein